MNARKKLTIRRGDLVAVIAGKDKGKQGKITRVLSKTERVVVEGVNVVKRHMKPSQTNPQGGIVTKESSIHVSNVNLVDPKTGKPTRVRFDAKTGARVAKSGAVIPAPEATK